MKINEVYGTPDLSDGYLGDSQTELRTELLKSISASGKSMFIDLRKQSYWGTVRFLASIKYNKVMPSCQSWLDVEKHILMFPNHYSNINCSWLISSNFGSYIMLNIKTQVNF